MSAARIEFWTQRDGVHVVLIGADRSIRKLAVWPVRVEVSHG